MLFNFIDFDIFFLYSRLSKALCTRERIRTAPSFFGSDAEFFRRAHGIGAKIICVRTGAIQVDPIRDKYIFDVEIPQSHELKCKKSVKASSVYEISLIPYLHLFLDPIRRFTRQPNGSEPQGSFLFSVPRWYG